jgi:hypothetical protein
MRVDKCDDAIVRGKREQEISDNALGAENRGARDLYTGNYLKRSSCAVNSTH